MENIAMQPPPVSGNGLDTDEMSTQPITQSTQPISEPDADPANGHLWGFLLPCSPRLRQIDFWKIRPNITLGRSTENVVQLPGMRISNKHCVIRWDGTAPGSPVVVLDMSSNGTFINGQKIGRGQSMLLHNGNEIAFGTPAGQPQNSCIEDYRFIFRFTAAGPARDGLWAHYDVSHELGTGSFATVHKAICRRTGEWVAVKMIRSNKLASPNGNNKGNSVDGNVNTRAISFAREIQILKDLDHPNICQLKETFWTETEISLVLELIEGGDLLDYILKKKGLDETDGLYITYQLSDALAYIHGQGVAHRDLKPENVLLTSDNPPIVKVADFGLAKYIDSLTMLRTMCGTPIYLAPEVARSNENGYGYIVDSWSVGVIVFSMFTASSPFIEDEDMDVILRIQSRTTDWSLLTSKHLSLEAQDFVRRLLDEDPNTRMSAEESLSHPWLVGTGDTLKAIRANQQNDQQPPPFAASVQPPNSRVVNSPMEEESLLSLRSDDVSMNPIATEGQAIPQNMNLDNHTPRGLAGSYSQISSSSENPTYRMPGAFHTTNGDGRGLQRRSLVIADAEANGRRLPEPSVEMIASAASRNLRNRTPHQVKRKVETSKQNGESDSSLTPLPEERDDEIMGIESEPELLPSVVHRRKRGRKSHDPETAQRAGGRRKSAVAAKIQRGRVIADSVGENDEEMVSNPVAPGLRKSPRKNRNR